MCDGCKHCKNYKCLLKGRKPTYEEYWNCNNFTLPDELEKQYQELVKEWEGDNKHE